MMMTEFEKLTGIYPGTEMYKAIEAAYMDSDMDKEAFCKAYRENKDGLASRIQVAADKIASTREEEWIQADKKQTRKIVLLKKEIEDLKEKLDREQGWKPYTDSGMTKEEYEDLKKSTRGRTMDPESAKKWIAREFGFDVHKIKVHTKIEKQEVNRHGQCRKTGETEFRPPIYSATDWNYCRFDVSGWKYEAINGQFYQYND